MPPETKSEYHAMPELSYSSLKNALKSAAYFKWRMDNPVIQTRAMLVGNLTEEEALKKLVFGLAAPETVYVVQPETYPAPATHEKVKKGEIKEGDPLPWHGAAAYCKAWAKDQTAPVISADDAKSIAGMVHSLQTDPHVQAILKLCPRTQVPVFGELHGLKLRGLEDLDGEDEAGIPMIGDLKTCQDSSESGFMRTIRSMHYDLQPAVYRPLKQQTDGLDRLPRWFWIAVERKPPFEANVFFMGKNLYERGCRKLKKAAGIVKRGLETGEWPTSGHGFKTLDITEYELAREDDGGEEDSEIPY